MATVVMKYSGDTELAVIRTGFKLFLIFAVCIFATVAVGTRDTGTDSANYASFFVAIRDGLPTMSVEPGFTLLTRGLGDLGLNVIGYQCSLFVSLLLIALLATKYYFRYLAMSRGYLNFFMISLALLFLSPTFAEASVNVLREGLATLIVFVALLAFQRKHWWAFIIYGGLAASLHRSSLLFFAFAPLLLLGQRTQRGLIAAAFVLYCLGLSRSFVQILAPSIYNIVSSYGLDSGYKAGVRLDFAIFSVFWYVLPFIMQRFILEPQRSRILESTSVYGVLMLPFFAVGWDSYSDRFLLPAWMAIALILGAVVTNCRVSAVRNSVVSGTLLLLSCPVLFYYVSSNVTF